MLRRLPEVPSLLMTGNEGRSEDSLAQGFQGHLKPANLEILCNFTDKTLKRELANEKFG